MGPKKVVVGVNVRPLAVMGAAALVLQQLADFGVGAFLRGITPAQQFVHFARPAGLINAALLIAFAATPILANRRPPDLHSAGAGSRRRDASIVARL
jgi:hypothetical protein